MRKSWLLFLFAAICLVVAPADAQVNLRAPILLDGTNVSSAYSPAVDSDGDVTAAAWNADGHVYVCVSDGRGLVWAPRVQVDNDLTAAGKRTDANSVKVVGDSIYVMWKDERNGASNRDLYFNCSHDKGITWTGEQWINKGYPAGTGSVRDQDLEAFAVTGNPDQVYVLVSVDPTGSVNEELYLVGSVDAGATFNAPVIVNQGSAPGANDIDYLGFSSGAGQVNIIWQENRSGSNDDIFFNSTNDAGATWAHAADLQLDTDGPAASDVDGSIFLCQNGNTLLAVWQDERAGGNEQLYGNVSLDGGATWMANDVLIGAYAPGTDDVDNPDAIVCANGNLVASWEDNRSGGDLTYIAVSTDNGMTWTEKFVSTSTGGYPAVEGAGDVVGVTWTAGSTPNTADAVFTTDGGANWSSNTLVSNNTGDVDYAEIGYNALYDNFFHIYLSDDTGTNNAYAAGFRPQTLTVNGPLVPGTPVSFTASNWFGGDTGFILLISANQGSLPIVDGRDVGVVWDAYAMGSVTLIKWGLTFAPIAGGTGTTVSFPWFGYSEVALGTVLNFVAVGVDPALPFPVGLLSDVVVETVQ